MAQAVISLPHGYRLAQFDQLDSTMNEAARRAQAAEAGNLWVWAQTQEQGRGRSGRVWTSEPGNLFASLFLRPDCPIGTALQLSLLAGIATHDAVIELAGDTKLAGELALKWPNDLLCGGKKIAGILLESFELTASGGLAVIIGIGLNLKSNPSETLHPAGNLAALGLEVETDRTLEVLASSCARWIGRWEEGVGFAEIREAWSERSIALDAPLRLRLDGEELNGVYAGIDKDGALLLRDNSGQERRISAGDVFTA